MQRLILLGGALLTLSACSAHVQSASSVPVGTAGASSTSARPADADGLLERLVGEWRMVGYVRGEPVTYTLSACRVLGGRYVELHMTDVQRPPQYEARVFVGADTAPGRVLVHWLDSFGARYSVPHAAGAVTGDTLRFEFAYPSGPFRDTFVFDRATGRWHFLLQGSDGRGGWKPFAEYEVRPEPRLRPESAAVGCQ